MRITCIVAIIVSAVVCTSAPPAQILACPRYCEYIESIGTEHELPVHRCDCWYRHQDASEMYGDNVVVNPRPLEEVPPAHRRQLTIEDFLRPLQRYSRLGDYLRSAQFQADMRVPAIAGAPAEPTYSGSREKPKAFKAERSVKAYKRTSDLSRDMRLLTIGQPNPDPAAR